MLCPGNRFFLVLYFLLLCLTANVQAQQDSIKSYVLPEFTVKAYFSEQPVLSSSSSIGMVDSLQLANHPDNSLVNSLNTVPGVRMEERSPGSYRLSIRGSVLRSPFGVRNIKVYLAGLLLTDAGGNTYINLIDPATVRKIEIIKGPEGSIYGANTGGVVLIDPVANPHDSLRISASVKGGSFGYVQAKVFFQKIHKRYLINISQSLIRSDGYRQNSASQQLTTQMYQQIGYGKSAQLKIFLLYTNLRYRTPGGLTFAQFDTMPRMARPATKTLPGAVEQKAGIYNNTILGGAVNEMIMKENLRHVVSLSASYTNFKNPFITNYEVRNESNVNLRTYIEWFEKEMKLVKWNWVNGIEAQQALARIKNYDNNLGERGDVQADYKFNAGAYYLFSRMQLDIVRKVTIEGAVSVNFNWYQYKNYAPETEPKFTNIFFKPQVMPRLGVAYRIIPSLAWRASVSRGYSPPTLAEVHPSADVVLNNLQPESGWCYETGFRFSEPQGYLWMDVTAYYYPLTNAIVLRQDTMGNSYFVNAGGTRQWGFEATMNIWAVKPKDKGAIRNLQLSANYTFNHNKFYNYQQGNENYSGNNVTGVPPHTLVSNVYLSVPLGFYLFVEHNYTAHILLNDANTAYAKHYNLLQAKIGWQYTFRHLTIDLYAGAANLLNQKYSLGNDLNAVGARYYNAAMGRNYYGGVSVGWGK